MAKIPTIRPNVAGGTRTQANAAAGINATSKAGDAAHSKGPNLAQRAAGTLRDAPWQLNQWNEFFKSWMPGISVTYRVRAQGSPATSSRTVLHLALATAFGMSVSRKAASIQITALIDHNNNAVEISYVVSTIAAEFAASQLLEGGWIDRAKRIAEKVIENNPFIPGITAEDVRKGTDYIRDGAKAVYDYITGEDAKEAERQRIEDKKDAELAEILAKKAKLDAQSRAAGDKLDAQGNAINPQVIPKGVPGGSRGINGDAGNVSRDAPWLVARNAVNAVGVAALKVKLAFQVDRLSTENGPKMLFELAPGQLFSGPAPAILSIRNAAVPFTEMVVDNSPRSGKPILTRALADNPQYYQALGADPQTLVAQVLFDPGTWPPPPRTDDGPPVTMDY